MKTHPNYTNKTKDELVQIIDELSKQVHSKEKQIQILEEYVLALKHRVCYQIRKKFC